MTDSTSRSDRLCDRCSCFLHFKSGEHGFFAEYTDEDGTVRLDFRHTRGGKRLWQVKPRFQFEDDYPAMTKLKRSASQGCGFCNMLANAIEKQVLVSGKRKAENKLNSLFIRRGEVLEDYSLNEHPYICGVAVDWRIADSKIKDDLSKGQVYRTCFKLLANQDTVAAQYLKMLHAPFNPSLLCSENIASIRQILSNCSEKHKDCTGNGAMDQSKHQALPSRLLQISKDQTGGYKIRLAHMSPTISPAQDGVNLKYAALSYCWGDQEFLKSTPENITDHYDNVRFSELPQGFRDTIELCWGIGIFYLWIDSLCIIQGNQFDWDRESAMMKDVYANAFLTIVIASTSSPLEGLSKGAPEQNPEIRVSYHLDDDNGSEITYFIQSKSWTDEFDDNRVGDAYALRFLHKYRTKSILQSNWSKRGWTFQENYLSTRKLFICAGHNDFSCQTSSHLQGALGIFPPLEDLRLIDGAKDWYSLVKDYSHRKLSRWEDKLPAISAVASQKGEELGRYVAGLWTKELEKGLLWAPRDLGMDPIRSRRSPSYIGPTWSWCAYDGPIDYGLLRHDPECTRAFEILEIRCTLAQPSAIYGRLSTADGNRAYLKIRAKVVPVLVQSRKDGVYPGGNQAVMEFGGIEMDGSTYIDCGETEHFSSPRRAVAMLVVIALSPSRDSGTSFGLLVRPTTSTGPVMTYERVGCFEYRYRYGYGIDMFKYISEFQELCLV